MVIVVGMLLIAVFLFLSGIHFYWSLGGQWGSGSVIPSKDDSVKVAMPGVLATLTVALGLLAFGLIISLRIAEFYVKLNSNLEAVVNFGLWVIAGIFILRAVGEFKYVGFFKKYKHTKFGLNDTKYYSPLCLLVGILTMLLLISR